MKTTPATQSTRRKAVVKVAPRKRTRDLSNAVWFKMGDLFQYCGAPPSTVRDWCVSLPVADRLPSKLIPGRSGRKGVRLIKKTDLDAWLAHWGPELPPAKEEAQ